MAGAVDDSTVNIVVDIIIIIFIIIIIIIIFVIFIKSHIYESLTIQCSVVLA